MPTKPKNSARFPKLNVLICQRLLGRDSSVSIIFLMTVIITIFCEFIDASWIYTIANFLGSLPVFFNSHKEFFSSFVLSIITGFIVYFFTVILPETRRSRLLLVEIEQTFEKITSSFTELSIELQLADLQDGEKAAQNAVQNIRKYGNRLSENHYNLSIYKNSFRKLADSFNKLSTYLLNYSSIFSYKELEMIVNLRQMGATKKLLYGYGIEEAITETEIISYIKELSSLSIEISALHSAFNKRITV